MSLTHNGLALDSNTRRSVDLLTRHIRHFGKFFRRLQQLAPIRFVELPMCGEMILFYWSQVDEATRGPLELIGGEDFHPIVSSNNICRQITTKPCTLSAFLFRGWCSSRRVFLDGLCILENVAFRTKTVRLPNVNNL